MAWIDGYHEPEKVVSTKIVSLTKLSDRIACGFGPNICYDYDDYVDIALKIGKVIGRLKEVRTTFSDIPGIMSSHTITEYIPDNQVETINTIFRKSNLLKSIGYIYDDAFWIRPISNKYFDHKDLCLSLTIRVVNANDAYMNYGNIKRHYLEFYYTCEENE